MVLLQIHWIMSETDIAKTVIINCGGWENVTLDQKLTFTVVLINQYLR